MIEKRKAQRHNLFLDTEHAEVLNEIIELKNLGQLKTMSKVVRFIILDYYELLTAKQKPKAQDIKLNAMGKDLSILLNLMCSLIANTPSLNLADKHVRNENVLLYWQAWAYVEAMINERKSGHSRPPTPPPEIKELLQAKTVDESYLEQLENEKRDEDFGKLFGLDPDK